MWPSIEKMPLDSRVYKCPICDIIINKDLNAAINIRNFALRTIINNFKNTDGRSGINACGDGSSGKYDAKDNKISIAVNKMLEAFGLHIKRRRFRLDVPGVTDARNSVAREFINKHGGKLIWHNNNPMQYLGIAGNGIGRGAWTVFKDDDEATFSLFTNKIDHFAIEHNGNTVGPNMDNPFYGCASVEEVLIKCDLLEKKDEDNTNGRNETREH